MSPSISVVIPTYNRAALVCRAIGSALRQVPPPLEVIVVDDGSSDDTEARVGAIAGPVRYLRQANGGVSSARNHGMSVAKGELICLLDSDDFLAPGALAHVVAAFGQDPACGAVFGDTLTVDEQERVLRRHGHRHLADDQGRVLLARLFEGRFALGSNFCFRRSLLSTVAPFDTGLATGEDIDFGLRIAAAAPVRHLEAELVNITTSPGSLSTRINTGNRLRVLDKFEREHPALARQHAHALTLARARTALAYARDLTVARRLPEAAEKAWLAWRLAPSREVALQLAKIGLLRAMPRR